MGRVCLAPLARPEPAGARDSTSRTGTPLATVASTDDGIDDAPLPDLPARLSRGLLSPMREDDGTMIVKLSTRNITKTYRATTPADRASGAEWYARARREAASLDPTDPARAAAVLAVLSPRLSWHVNVNLARVAYAQHGAGLPVELPTLKGNSRKAARILAGADPELVVSGPKVTAFWRTITDPTDRWAVVVDRHAFDIAAGRVTDDATRTAGLAGKRYDAACELYRRAARILSRESGTLITPTQVQATTWVYWRRERTSGQGALIARDDVRAA